MSPRALGLALQRLPSALSRPSLLPRRILSLPPRPLRQTRSLRRALPSVRHYATQAPGPNEEETLLEQLTPEERERDAMHKKAQEYLEAERLDEVEKLYTQLLDRKDLTPHEILFVNYNLGLLHHQQGDTQKAGRFWEDSLDVVDQLGTSPEEKGLVVAATMNLGTLYVVNGKPEKGLRHLQTAARMEPRDGEIRFNLASALASLGNYVEALKEFRAAEAMGITSSQQPIEKLQQIIDEAKKKDE